MNFKFGVILLDFSDTFGCFLIECPRVVKFPGIYSPGNIPRNISKLGINGNKFQSLKYIKKPILGKIPMKHIVKLVLPVDFGTSNLFISII